MTEIVLVRHAESEANLAGAWQGRGDAAVSDGGRTQIEALAARAASLPAPDLVLSSPLARAVESARAFGSPENADDLIEIDLGRWEGVSFDVVASTDMDRLRAIYGGSDDPFGDTGERMSEVAARAWAVVDDAARRVGSDGRAILVTHGGVIDSLLVSLLPTVTRRPHRMAANASLTHLVGGPGDWRLARLNDTGHLGTVPAYASHHLDKGEAVLALIRHGRTRANVDERFQGQSCWGLDEVGEAQADRLAEWYGSLDTVYSSPLDRAVATARRLNPDPVLTEGLMEIAFGEWEGLGRDEIEASWADLARRIYIDGEDLARGRTGETWRDATRRISATIQALEAPTGEVTGVVFHGGVLRAYVGTIGGDATSTRSRLATPENTSVTHVALTASGPVLCDYAVAPHLESLSVATP